MSAQAASDRWQEIRAIQRENRYVYQIGGGLLLVIIGILIGGGLFSDDPGYKTNLYTEVLSIGITVMILNALAERREDRRRIRDLQERLVMEAGSWSNETAKRAIDELRHRGWLEGENGLLKGKNLWGANLQEANLLEAKLQGADLVQAKLQGALLQHADLQGARMGAAKLQGAYLGVANLQGALLLHADLQAARLLGANLQGAYFELADLQGADMREVKLQGANLRAANLQEVNLGGAHFDENTVLPDWSNWKPETDMTRFTDPNHPNFWRSTSPRSPAYHGKSDADARA